MINHSVTYIAIGILIFAVIYIISRIQMRAWLTELERFLNNKFKQDEQTTEEK